MFSIKKIGEFLRNCVFQAFKFVVIVLISNIKFLFEKYLYNLNLLV